MGGSLMRRTVAGSLSAILAYAASSAALAQSSGSLAVRDSTGATQHIACQFDLTGVCHYRDVLEGLGPAGSPAAWTLDANGNGGVADVNSTAFQGEIPLTIGVADTTGRRSLKAVCTTAGNISVTYQDGSTGVWPVAVGAQTLPISITTVNAPGTTAICTYANLK